VTGSVLAKGLDVIKWSCNILNVTFYTFGPEDDIGAMYASNMVLEMGLGLYKFTA